MKTWWDKYPFHLTLDFLDNPRAASNHNHALWAEAAVGQTKDKHDLQFGYAFGRIEQDAADGQVAVALVGSFDHIPRCRRGRGLAQQTAICRMRLYPPACRVSNKTRT